jgi:hypothetical protein
MTKGTARALVLATIFLASVSLTPPAAASAIPPAPAAASAASPPPAAGAQSVPASRDDEVRSLRIRPVEGEIRIDGRLSEPDWERAQPATGFVQQVPNPGRPASMETEARVLLGDDAIYVGVRLFDPAPDSIVGRLARRGVANESDWVYVSFDSHFDRRSAFAFGVNAAGVKRDLRVVDDVRQDPSWDAVWDVEVARDEHGWTAEFRIPLSQLRFAAGEGERTWGFNVRREIARTGEIAYWAPVERNSGSYVSSFGLLNGIRLDRGPRRVEVVPYVTSRVERAPGNPSDPYFDPTNLDGGAGADLRVGLSSWLTLDATVNPDFGQVEADPSVVNLTAFEVFLPERRPFFVEGAEYFNTPGSNLFYSRRIGRTPQLPPPPGATFSERSDRTTILGATKLTGRSPGGWSVGALTALTAQERVRYTTEDGEERAVVEPRTTYTFARLGHDFRDGRSAINVTGTRTGRDLGDGSRLRVLHEHAYAGGVDWRHRFLRDELELSGTFHVSRVEGDSAAIVRTQRAPGRYFDRPDAEHLDFRADRTSLTGRTSSLRFAKVGGGSWRAGVTAGTTSPGFEVNDLGLQFGVDQRWEEAWVGYHQFAAGRYLRSWSAQLRQSGMWTTGGERSHLGLLVNADAELRNRWRIGMVGMRDEGGVNPDHLRGGPAWFSAGRWVAQTSLTTDRQRALSGHLMAFGGRSDQGESSDWTAQGEVRWRPSDRSELRLGPNVSRRTSESQFVTRAEVQEEPRYILSRIDQTTASLSARLNFAVSPTLSLEVHAQPFVAAGRYGRFGAVVPEAAGERARHLRLAPYSEEALEVVETEDGRRLVEIDETGDGSVDIRFPLPDFNQKNLRSTAVLRWEYRPGSTFFLVWSHDRARFDADGRFDLSRDLDRLRGAPGRSVFAVKGTYRIEL